MEKAVDVYEKELAGSIGRVGKLLDKSGRGEQATPLTIDLAGLIESFQGVAKGQVSYLADMAKADALGLLGEAR